MSYEAAPTAELLCPSGRAEPDAILVGVVGPDARVQYLPSLARVDAEWLSEARAAGNPRLEQRYRFAEPCQPDKCINWAGDHCGVATAAIESHAERQVAGPVSACSIRKHCRWFAERGTAACRGCSFVVRDVDLQRGYGEPGCNP